MPNLPKVDNRTIMIEAARAELDSLLAQAKRMESIIAALHATPEQEKSLPPVKPNEFRGMRAVDALETYLRARRGMKIPLSTAVQHLVEGGADPGRPRGRLQDPFALIAQTIKISFSNKTDIFDWEPKAEINGRVVVPDKTPTDKVLVWLAETADTPRRRQRPKRQRAR